MSAVNVQGLKAVQTRAPRTSRRSARVVCQAHKEAAPSKVASVVGAAALAALVSVADVQPAQADVAGLTPCAESKQFARKQKGALAKLEKRRKQYEPGSAPAVALQATIDKTKKRFDFYASKGLLCGTDGLPHLISDPGLALRYGHAGEVFIPTFGFLYVAGYIGWAGREYLIETRKAKKPTDMEIIIDVPKALAICGRSLAWPAAAVAALRDGDLLEKDENITVSPR
ncbi:unnamed protein product [Pedinophyceae sp. YPF-701]|nr:unnamed protein product [Pedinophyceae sp. YPF-701]